MGDPFKAGRRDGTQDLRHDTLDHTVEREQMRDEAGLAQAPALYDRSRTDLNE